MNRRITPHFLLYATVLVAGCSHDAAPDRTLGSTAAVREGDVCDIDRGCPGSLTCGYVEGMADGKPVCVDLDKVCDDVNCGDRDCVIAESHPAQIFCGGNAEKDPDATADQEASMPGQTCSVDQGCADNLDCAYLRPTGSQVAICVDLATICEDLDCEDRDCAIAESYPAQVYCTGRADKKDALDPACSDDDCPDGDQLVCDGEDCGTEPSPGSG